MAYAPSLLGVTNRHDVTIFGTLYPPATHRTYEVNVLEFFSAKNAVNFGKSLADELNEQYPVALDTDSKKKVSADRIGRILERIYLRAQTHRDEHSLGYYKKTRLCHAFKWRLGEIGYTKAFIDLATEGLVVYLHKPKQ